ncbi:receptor-transporting protein 2 isoform X2 [Nycticebus coucang]|nr:receptor-transporting protein 2 isoform X2 [Nycticebus coucang]XP_053421228.1 receptor-transporting protein 2 isoform X2 [Nycticebus coucang]
MGPEKVSDEDSGQGTLNCLGSLYNRVGGWNSSSGMEGSAMEVPLLLVLAHLAVAPHGHPLPHAPGPCPADGLGAHARLQAAVLRVRLGAAGRVQHAGGEHREPGGQPHYQPARAVLPRGWRPVPHPRGQPPGQRAAPPRVLRGLPGGHRALEAQPEAAGRGGQHLRLRRLQAEGPGVLGLQLLLPSLVPLLGLPRPARCLPAVLIPQLLLPLVELGRAGRRAHRVGEQTVGGGSAPAADSLRLCTTQSPLWALVYSSAE